LLLNYISYKLLKNRILQRQKWDLNICCGKTDGCGINVDIVVHTKLLNQAVVDVFRLPFKDYSFNSVLCSHTIEHVDDPVKLYRELNRVGRHVTFIVPSLWDISAAMNELEHRLLF
jgi:SAM-dependent methyltransferase